MHGWGCVSVYQEHVEFYVETREPEWFVKTSHFQPKWMTLHTTYGSLCTDVMCPLFKKSRKKNDAVEFEHALGTYNTTLGINQLLAAYYSLLEFLLCWAIV